MLTSSKAISCTRAVLAAALVSLFAAGSALAVEPPNPKDLTQGKWELIPEKSKFCKPVPRKSNRHIYDAGWGLIVAHWTGLDPQGRPVDTRYVWRYDGEKYPATIMGAADEAISWKLVSPHRVEFIHWDKNDKITEELYREVSADGQEMTQSRKYLGAKADGKDECVDIQVFKRV